MFLLPSAVSCLFIPRRVVMTHYFTWHAELLPHTEQVVFHKAGPFGTVRKSIVDIKNLEKCEPEYVTNNLLWQMNRFDADLVFRDTHS